MFANTNMELISEKGASGLTATLLHTSHSLFVLRICIVMFCFVLEESNLRSFVNIAV